MGVDPIADQFPHVTTYNYAENEPIAHIDLWGLQKVLAIMYHGGPTGGGKTTTPAAAGHTGEFYKATERAAAESNREFEGRVIAPGFTSASGVSNGYDFITENYEDGDQVILYGYSYGVDVAMDLATKVEEDNIPVDLLITVDGSDGPLQNATVNKDVPENVRVNINFYQTDDSGVTSSSRSTGATSSNSYSQSSSSDSGTSNFPGSNGSRNRGTGNTEVHNINATGSGVTHGNIQQKQDGYIRMYIRQAIQNYQKNN